MGHTATSRATRRFPQASVRKRTMIHPRRLARCRGIPYKGGQRVDKSSRLRASSESTLAFQLAIGASDTAAVPE